MFALNDLETTLAPPGNDAINVFFTNQLSWYKDVVLNLGVAPNVSRVGCSEFPLWESLNFDERLSVHCPIILAHVDKFITFFSIGQEVNNFVKLLITYTKSTIMKVLFSVAIFLFGFSVSFGQITLTDYDMPGIGDSLKEAKDTIPPIGITIGAAGANKTWDYSNLQNDKEEFSLFLNPDSLPMNSLFPDANLGLSVPKDSMVIYLKTSSAKVELLGIVGDLFGVGTPVAWPFENPETFVIFPTTYQTNFQDNSKRVLRIANSGMFPPNFDSIQLSSTSTINDTIDGWGTLITPSGTYNALRKKKTSYTSTIMSGKDKTLGWINFPTQNEVSYEYNWFSHHAVNVLMLGMDTTGTIVIDATYSLDPPATGIKGDMSLPVLINAYPNPVQDKLIVEYHLLQTADVKLVIDNMLGQRINILEERNQIPGKYTFTINNDEFTGSSSVYFLKLYMGDRVAVRQIISVRK